MMDCQEFESTGARSGCQDIVFIGTYAPDGMLNARKLS